MQTIYMPTKTEYIYYGTTTIFDMIDFKLKKI